MIWWFGITVFPVNFDLHSFFHILNRCYMFTLDFVKNHYILQFLFDVTIKFFQLKLVTTLNYSYIVLTLFIFPAWILILSKRNIELDQGKRKQPYPPRSVFCKCVVGSLRWERVGWACNDLSLLLRILAKALCGIPGAPQSIGSLSEYFWMSVFKHLWLLSFFKLDWEPRFNWVRKGEKVCPTTIFSFC